MAQQSINIGSGPNTKDGDPIREAFRKTEENFTELYNVAENNSISITDLKSLVAASTDFNDFKARIAAL
jgi:hypothetical protein